MEVSWGFYEFNEENEDVKIFWKRFFVLRMIYCYLGIGKCCKIFLNFEIFK